MEGKLERKAAKGDKAAKEKVDALKERIH